VAFGHFFVSYFSNFYSNNFSARESDHAIWRIVLAPRLDTDNFDPCSIAQELKEDSCYPYS